MIIEKKKRSREFVDKSWRAPLCVKRIVQKGQCETWWRYEWYSLEDRGVLPCVFMIIRALGECSLMYPCDVAVNMSN